MTMEHHENIYRSHPYRSGCIVTIGTMLGLLLMVWLCVQAWLRQDHFNVEKRDVPTRIKVLYIITSSHAYYSTRRDRVKEEGGVSLGLFSLGGGDSSTYWNTGTGTSNTVLVKKSAVRD